MNYLTAKQLSEKWGLSERRIIQLCQEKRIDGTIKNGMVWNIPEDAMKPTDQRSTVAEYIPTQKQVLVANLNTPIGEALLPRLQKRGYRVEGICQENAKVDRRKMGNSKLFQADFENRESLKNFLKQTGKYYDGFIFIDTRKSK